MRRWKGFERKESRKSAKIKKTKLKWTVLLYIIALLIILAIIYISYTTILPQLASIIGGDGTSTQATNATKTLVKITYIKG